MPFFEALKSRIQMSFSQASSDYNQIHQLAKRIEDENQKLDKQSVVLTGLTNMITNRYHGVTSLRSVWAKGMEGGYWAWYFGTAPTLQQDTQKAATVWARSLLTLPNLNWNNMFTMTSTALGTTSQDIVRLQDAGHHRVMQESQFLGASVVASMSISSLLKQAGQRVQQQYAKQFIRTARVSWQVTGVLAFVYGLSRITDALNDSGSFAVQLKVQRDQYLTTQRQAIDRRFEPLLRQMQEQDYNFFVD